jgi:hypothetical protein
MCCIRGSLMTIIFAILAYCIHECNCIAPDDGLRIETCSGSDKKIVVSDGIIGNLINYPRNGRRTPKFQWNGSVSIVFTLRCRHGWKCLPSHWLKRQLVHITSYPMGCWGVNKPGREADHSPPSSAGVKNALSYTSTALIHHGAVLN